MATVDRGIARDKQGIAVPLGTDVTNGLIIAYDSAVELNTSDAPALNGDNFGVTLVATTDCHVRIETTATETDATTNDFRLPAETPVQVPIAGIERISVIKSSAAGNLHVLEIL